MNKHTIKELTHTLNISRGRVYQIINSLTDSQKVHKDSNGNYILDDEAVHNIRSYFEMNTQKDAHKSSDEHDVKRDEQLDDLKRKNSDYERQIDNLNKQIKLQQELIDSLKHNNDTLTAQLNIKDEQILKANQLADQAQKLNAADKQKEIEHKDEKKSFAERVSNFFSNNSKKDDQ